MLVASKMSKMSNAKIKKSIEVLKKLQLKNGGILATPLNGAYPYIYTRDGVIMTKALNCVGLHKNSEKFYYYMKKILKLDNYKEVFHRYNANGLPCVTRKKENDNAGLLLHGIYDTYLHNKKETFIENMWPIVEKVAEIIIFNSKFDLIKTERSIHEFFRLENGYEIWANCACWRGLKDAIIIADHLGHSDKSKKWKNKLKKIENKINKKFFNKKLGIFVKNLKYQNIPDISQLAPFYFGLSNSKEILRKTMNYLKKHLWDKEIGGFRRFRKFEICEDWHWYTGGNGSWCPFAAWGARFYGKLGEKKLQKECIQWLHKIASKSNGLLPEHIATEEEYEDWKNHEIEFNTRIINETKKAEKSVKNFKDKKIVYWATPLGWSHAEYILLHAEKTE